MSEGQTPQTAAKAWGGAITTMVLYGLARFGVITDATAPDIAAFGEAVKVVVELLVAGGVGFAALWLTPRNKDKDKT